jgi:hypothetical protein
VPNATSGATSACITTAIGARGIDVVLDAEAQGFVDDGADVGGQVRIAHAQVIHRALEDGGFALSPRLLFWQRSAEQR